MQEKAMGHKMIETFISTVIVKNVFWDRFVVSHEGVTFVVGRSSELSNDMPVSSVPCERHLHEGCESKEGLQNNTDIRPEYCIRDQMFKLNIESSSNQTKNIIDGHENEKAHGGLRLFVNGYLLSLFVKCLQESTYYRRSVITHFTRCCQNRDQFLQSQLQVSIKLTYPRRDIIDYAWSHRVEILLVERRELENAMSWFSTLGGAFSALGDQFERCAEIAGRISVQQLKIALRLGDPYTVARCKLYLALSLLQRGHLKPAKRIILEQYKLAKTPPVLDHRLIRMCLGIWAKLKFDHRRRRTEQKKKKQKQYALQQQIIIKS